MTYLDPDQTHHNAINWRQWLARIAAVAAVSAVAWLALTLGSGDGSVQPDIVSEPVATDPALQAQ